MWSGFYQVNRSITELSSHLILRVLIYFLICHHKYLTNTEFSGFIFLSWGCVFGHALTEVEENEGLNPSLNPTELLKRSVCAEKVQGRGAGSTPQAHQLLAFKSSCLDLTQRGPWGPGPGAPPEFQKESEYIQLCHRDWVPWVWLAFVCSGDRWGKCVVWLQLWNTDLDLLSWEESTVCRTKF